MTQRRCTPSSKALNQKVASLGYSRAISESSTVLG
jgi:hypothetical protein